MQLIKQFNRCKVVQQTHNIYAVGDVDSYDVVSNNDIIIFQASKVVQAMEYAEWFDSKYQIKMG